MYFLDIIRTGMVSRWKYRQIHAYGEEREVWMGGGVNVSCLRMRKRPVCPQFPPQFPSQFPSLPVSVCPQFPRSIATSRGTGVSSLLMLTVYTPRPSLPPISSQLPVPSFSRNGNLAVTDFILDTDLVQLDNYGGF